MLSRFAHQWWAHPGGRESVIANFSQILTAGKDAGISPHKRWANSRKFWNPSLPLQWYRKKGENPSTFNVSKIYHYSFQFLDTLCMLQLQLQHGKNGAQPKTIGVPFWDKKNGVPLLLGVPFRDSQPIPHLISRNRMQCNFPENHIFHMLAVLVWMSITRGWWKDMELAPSPLFLN